MYQQDYILRIVEQATKALFRILRLKEDGSYQEALAVLNRTRQGLLGPKLLSVDHLSEDDWRTQIKSDKNLDRWILLARLFKEEGDIYEAVDKFDESHISYLQSLTIFLNVLSDADRTTAQLQFVHVHALVMQLEKYPLALADRFDIFHFYERAGAYAQAEDWLFKSIQAFPDNNQPIQDGISFYERLLAMDDAELVRGDLPRNEVEAALAELRGAAMKSPCYSAARDESG